MSGFMGNLRGGADKAAFEAKKFARIQAEQLRLGKERSQRTTQIQMLGEAAWELYQAGQITEPKLLDICLLIQQTTTEIARIESAIDNIRQEQPPKCSNCGRELKPTDQFCANCGARAPGAAAGSAANATAGTDAAVSVSMPQAAVEQKTAQPVPPSAPTPALCPQCGHPVRAGAAFCGRCGSKITT
jgi:hypothetical protein